MKSLIVYKVSLIINENDQGCTCKKIKYFQFIDQNLITIRKTSFFWHFANLFFTISPMFSIFLLAMFIDKMGFDRHSFIIDFLYKTSVLVASILIATCIILFSTSESIIFLYYSEQIIFIIHVYFIKKVRTPL